MSQWIKKPFRFCKVMCFKTQTLWNQNFKSQCNIISNSDLQIICFYQYVKCYWNIYTWKNYIENIVKTAIYHSVQVTRHSINQQIPKAKLVVCTYTLLYGKTLSIKSLGGNCLENKYIHFEFLLVIDKVFHLMSA